MRRLILMWVQALLSIGETIGREPCFLDAEAARRNLSSHGEEFPLRIFRFSWISSLIESEMAKIILEEKLGVNVEYDPTVGSSSWYTTRALVGCQPLADKWSSCIPDASTPHPAGHLVFEAWPIYIPSGYEAAIGVPDELSPFLLPLSYEGEEAMCLRAQLAEVTFSQTGLDLSFYRTYDVKWHHVNRFFNTTHDVDIVAGSSPMSCSVESPYNTLFQKQSVELYVNYTGDTSGVTSLLDGTLVAACDNGWWYSPECRLNPSQCIPFVTINSYLVNAVMQWATFFNMPLAIGTYPTSMLETYQSVVQYTQILFFETLHSPKYSNLESIPTRVMFPVTDKDEVARKLFRTGVQSQVVVKGASRSLQKIDPKVFEFFQKFTLYQKEVAEVTITSRTHSVHDTACAWLRSHTDRWESWLPQWMPVPTDCDIGTGLVNLSGHFVSSRSSAATCETCPPGRYSASHSDEKGLTFECRACARGRFSRAFRAEACSSCPVGSAQELIGQSECYECERGKHGSLNSESNCTACTIGRFSSAPASLQCEKCAPGSIANANGTARCGLCERGRFISSSGGSFCEACEGQHRITKELGAHSSSLCVCEEGYYETQDQQPDCLPCLEGMFCAFGSSMVNYWDALHGIGSVSAPYPLLKEKYFAFSDSPLDVFECIAKESCPGMRLAGRSPCCAGCRGLNCGLCESDKFHTGGVCEPCLESGWQMPVALSLAPFALGVFHHFVSYRASKKEVLNSAILAKVTVGVAVFFAQVMGLYYRLLIDWPVEVSAFFEGSSLLMFNFEIFRASCTFTDSLGTRFGLQVAAPIFVGICFSVLLPLSWILSSLTGGRFPVYSVASILNAMGWLFQAMYISLVAMSISIFECYDSPNGKKALRLYSFVECGSANHNEVVPLGVASLLVYVVGFMALCVLCNYIAPQYYSNAQFALSVRFLIYKFRPSTWWYGIVLMVRSALIGMVAVMEPGDGNIQAYLMVTFLILSLVVHLEIAPYIQRCANRAELFGLTLLIIILVFGLWFIPKKEDASRDTALTVAILACVGLVSFMVAGLLCYSLISAIYQERFLQSQRNELRKALQAIETAFSIFLAMPSDHMEDLLLRGNYTDHWHLFQASRFILVQECGIQGRKIRDKRITRQISQGEESLRQQQDMATEKIVRAKGSRQIGDCLELQAKIAALEHQLAKEESKDASQNGESKSAVDASHQKSLLLI